MIPDKPSLSIASDERARIPFAVIGVLLLLSSVAIVAALETRQEPESNIDPSLALDRAESSSQAAVKDAMLDASQDAAASPVTERPDDDDAVFDDQLLGPDDTDDMSDREVGDRVFHDYVSLLVYREASTRIDGTKHTIRENATTEVTLEPIESRGDAEDAIDRVEFSDARDSNDLPEGTTEVTIEDVEFEVRQEGDMVAERTRDVEVTVATPLFDVHQKTQTYQQRLQMGMLQGSGIKGMGKQLALRTYPLVITKSTINYVQGNVDKDTAPLKRIVPNEQTEVMANHANYGVQSNVFGTRDPDWKLPMTINLMCWLDWEYESNYRDGEDLGGMFPKKGDVIPSDPRDRANSSSSRTLCETVEEYYETADGALDSATSLWDVLSGDPPSSEGNMQQDEEFNYTLFARQAYGDINRPDEHGISYDRTGAGDERGEVNAGDQGVTDEAAEIEDIVENVYSMDVRVVESSTSNPSFSTNPTKGGDWVARGSPSFEYEDESEDVRIDPEWESYSGSDTEPLLFTIHVEDQVRETETQEFVRYDDRGRIAGTDTESESDTGWATVTYEVYGEYAPDSTIDDPDSGGDEGYEDDINLPAQSGHVDDLFGSTGGGTDPPGPFDRAPVTTLEVLFGVDGMTGAESDIANLVDGDRNTNPDEVADSLGNPTAAEPRLGPEQVSGADVGAIESYAHDALETGETRIEELDPIYFERTDFVTGNPHQEAFENLKDQRDGVVFDGEDRDPFDAMPEFLRTEVLHQTHKTAVIYNHRAASEHDSGMEQNDISNGPDGALSGGLDMLDKVDGEKPAYGGTIDSSDMLGTVSFQVRGSPTYLEFDEVERVDDEVPSIRPEDQMAQDKDLGGEELEHVAASGCYDDRLTWFGLPIIPWPGSWYVTADSWHVRVKGEYSRFEVTANVSDPSRAPSLSYVREDKAVPMEIAGERGEIGGVEPIGIETWAETPMIVPAGKSGVGDTIDDSEDYSTEWNYVGPDWESQDEDDYPIEECPPDEESG